MLTRCAKLLRKDEQKRPELLSCERIGLFLAVPKVGNIKKVENVAEVRNIKESEKGSEL